MLGPLSQVMWQRSVILKGRSVALAASRFFQTVSNVPLPEMYFRVASWPDGEGERLKRLPNGILPLR